MHTDRIVLTAALVPFAASAAMGSFMIADHDGEDVIAPADVTAPPAVLAPPAAEPAPDTQAAPVPRPIAPTTAQVADAVRDIAVEEPDSPPQPGPESSFADEPVGAPHPDLGPHTCVDADPAEAISHVFDGAPPLIGADYQRAFPLPDGRVLWLFQDAFVDTPSGPTLIHNVGLLQSGTCFQLLQTGSAETPAPYLFADVTTPHTHWFWPLGGAIGEDGRLHVFVAELRERSDRYLGHVEPLATWTVTIDAATLAVVDRRPAPNPGAELYGWSVVSQREHTYLYAHCYRQFGWDPFPGSESTSGTHDWDCTADVTVARVPRGQFDAEPEYWNGAQWVSDAEGAVAVIPTEGRAVNPTQVAVVDDRFIAVTKVDDWWGTDIHLDVAPTPFGPWTTYDIVAIEARCDACNTYFASFVPFGATDETFTVAVSNNHWRNGDVIEHYRPSVLEVAMPT